MDARPGGRIVVDAWRYKRLKYDFKLIAADALSYSIIGRLVNGLTGNALDKFLTKLADSPREMICDKLAVIVMQGMPELAWRGSLVEAARSNNPEKLFTDEAVFEPMVTAIRGNPKSKTEIRKQNDDP